MEQNQNPNPHPSPSPSPSPSPRMQLPRFPGEQTRPRAAWRRRRRMRPRAIRPSDRTALPRMSTRRATVRSRKRQRARRAESSRWMLRRLSHRLRRRAPSTPVPTPTPPTPNRSGDALLGGGRQRHRAAGLRGAHRSAAGGVRRARRRRHEHRVRRRDARPPRALPRWHRHRQDRRHLRARRIRAREHDRRRRDGRVRHQGRLPRDVPPAGRRGDRRDARRRVRRAGLLEPVRGIPRAAPGPPARGRDLRDVQRPVLPSHRRRRRQRVLRQRRARRVHGPRHGDVPRIR
ncbi:hypothetical protein BFL35_13025 [Clavibacter michiganensis]|nr:hypothetical protein BFL35_13025 [Clavibacter michiganensis]